MKYHKTVKLKDGRDCCLRNGEESDGAAALAVFNLTHEQTDYLLTYPDENCFSADQESAYLKAKTDSGDALELIAEVDGKVVGTAGFEPVGTKYKVRHRADFGVSIDRDYWGLGIGRALLEACIVCARSAGYAQLELNVVADNKNAVHLYQSLGFTEYGRNPKGFYSRISGDQELILMRLEL